MKVLDLQRLADRAVQRFGKASNGLTRIDMNHLGVFIENIDAALKELETADTDELQVISTQLAVLKSIHEREAKSTLSSPGEEPLDSSEEDIAVSPQPQTATRPQAAAPSAFSRQLRHRQLPSSRRAVPGANGGSSSSSPNHPATNTIFREEHDQLTKDLLQHSLALKANSQRMTALLREDQQSLQDAEHLMDTTEGEFSEHSKRLSEQSKAEAWGLIKVFMVLVVGFAVFLVMYLFIRLT